MPRLFTQLPPQLVLARPRFDGLEGPSLLRAFEVIVADQKCENMRITGSCEEKNRSLLCKVQRYCEQDKTGQNNDTRVSKRVRKFLRCVVMLESARNLGNRCLDNPGHSGKSLQTEFPSSHTRIINLGTD
jgi:hypothetical protein